MRNNLVVFIVVIFISTIGYGNIDSINLVLISSNLAEVRCYEKLDLGIGLPKNLLDKVQNFVKSKDPIKFNERSLDHINPFDPNQIDIQIDFWQPNEVSIVPRIKIFGFYYEAYADRKDEIVSVGTSYNLRGRFTPQKTGLWNCQAIVIVNNDTLRSSILDFVSTPDKSFKKGFLEVADNNQYFKLKDSSFFPVGQNIPWPGKIWYNSKETLPHKNYTKYHRLIKEFKEDGGNYFRMLLTPWTYDIEFETLGNYSNRMSNAWELDQLLEFAAHEELKIHFNMLLHGVLENPSVYTITNWDWPSYQDSVYTDKTCVDKEDNGFCYQRELGLSHPIEFFTDAEAIRFYKNKVRYIISRWGYSTSIGVIELLSEINNSGQQGNLQNTGKGCPNLGTISVPYRDLKSVPKIILLWQNEIAKYIKEELNHTNHLVAVSYTSEPDIKNGDLSYYSPFVDVPTYNAYSFDPKQNKYARLVHQLENYRKEKLQISNSSLKYHDSRRSIKLDKPFMLSEIGSARSECDGDAIWNQSVFLSPFTGLSGVAMPWLNFDNNRNLWKYFGFINAFMSTINLSTGEWKPKYEVASSKKVELYYLKSSLTNSIAGAINNRTYNYFTMKNSCENCFCTQDTVALYLSNLISIENELKENQLILRKMGMFKHYRVQYFDPFSNNAYGSELAFRTNLFGKANLPYPTILKDRSPILYFKILEK